MENESGEAKRGEVQHKRRTSALFENHEQPDTEVNQADQVYVEVACRPILDRSQVIEVGIIVTRFRRVGGPLDKVMNFSTDSGVVEVDLDVFGVGDLFAFRAPRDIRTTATVRTDREQMIAGNQSGSGCGGTRFDSFGDDTLRSINPSDAVPRRRMMLQPLRKVQRSGGNQQCRRYEQQPSPPC